MIFGLPTETVLGGVLIGLGVLALLAIAYFLASRRGQDASLQPPAQMQSAAPSQSARTTTSTTPGPTANPLRPQTGGARSTQVIAQPRPTDKIPEHSIQPPLGTAYLEAYVYGMGRMYYPLKSDQTVIGRDPTSDIVINGSFSGAESVSRRHAEVVRDQDQYILADLDSSNGVFVNNRRVGRNLLGDGALITIGKVSFTFRLNRESRIP